MSRRAKAILIWTLVVVFAPLGALLLVTIVGEIVKQLWNWLLPPLFGWPQITRWQGLGLLVLCRILFGGHGHVHRSNSRRRGPRDYKFALTGTPEEREGFRQRIRKRFGCGPSTSENEGQ